MTQTREEKRAYAHAYYIAHRDEKIAANKAYYRAHLEERRAYLAANREMFSAYRAARVDKARDRSRKFRYGISPEWVAEMLDAQEGQCAICSDAIDVTAHVDHNHATGEARALLCSRCNKRLGQVEDVEWLDSALSYLEVHAA